MTSTECKTSEINLVAKEATLVVSALNEEKLIESTVHSIVENANKSLSDYEIILVNDGSIDRTGEIMERIALCNPKIKVIHNPKNLGLGGSFKRALTYAKFDYYMFLCGDGGFPGESLPLVFAKLGEADLVIPYMSNLKKIKTPFRYLLSRMYPNFLNIIFRQKLNYYNGLPLYKTKMLKQLKINCNGFGFQAEIVTKLLKSGCNYIEAQVRGAEESNRSVALTFTSFIKVSKTLLSLIIEIFLFNPKSVKKL